MKKVVIDHPGGYEKLLIREYPDPKPGPGEVLITTHASGVNFADCCVRMGVYQSAREFIGFPITPGFEVAGTVAAIGEGVKHVKVGQKVIAITFFGGYSTHVIAKERFILPMPDFLSFAEAASLPTVFLTAYYALFELAHVKEGDKVLIHSAAGGVGSALIQLGKIAKCDMVAVVGTSRKVSYVNELGVTQVIDKSSQDLWAEANKLSPKGYDIILDANGIETLQESYNHLSAGGKLVVYGFHTMFSKGRGKPNWAKMVWDYLRTPRFNPLQMTNDNHSVLAFNLSYLFDKTKILEEVSRNLLKWINDKKIVPPQITTYPLEDVVLAHQALETGKTVGKLVLTC